MREWHIITCEYPPQVGGVSDYTALLSQALRDEGQPVHVWAPGSEETSSAESHVHRVLGNFDSASLAHTDELLDQYPSPRTLLVQWVPHGYGRRSMNIGFCRWLAKRVRHRGDLLQLMVHEPFLEFRGIRQSAAASVHRWMVWTLLHAAERVWLSIPGWESKLRMYAPSKLAHGLAPDSEFNSAHCDAGVHPRGARKAGESAAITWTSRNLFTGNSRNAGASDHRASAIAYRVELCHAWLGRQRSSFGTASRITRSIEPATRHRLSAERRTVSTSGCVRLADSALSGRCQFTAFELDGGNFPWRASRHNFRSFVRIVVERIRCSRDRSCRRPKCFRECCAKIDQVSGRTRSPGRRGLTTLPAEVRLATSGGRPHRCGETRTSPSHLVAGTSLDNPSTVMRKLKSPQSLARISVVYRCALLLSLTLHGELAALKHTLRRCFLRWRMPATIRRRSSSPMGT